MNAKTLNGWIARTEYVYAHELLEDLIEIQERVVSDYSKLSNEHYQRKHEAKQTLSWLKVFRKDVKWPSPNPDQKKRSGV